jgi:ABC-type nitrate/sulfonate/bicarbonate transport system substrate-binding protein
MKRVRRSGAFALSRRAATAAVALLTIASFLVTACAAVPTSSQRAARTHRLVVREESAARKRLAVTADGGGLVFRLGLVPQLADAAGLVGAQLGYFQQDLGDSVRLQLVLFASQAQEGQALAAGRLDGAYVNPVTAVRVWLASDHKVIKVLAGTSARDGDRAVAVLAVATRLLRTRPATVAAIVQGQIQSEQIIDTDPARALPAIRAELAALRVRRVKERMLARSFAGLTYTNNPLASSVLAQATHAASAGLIAPLPSSLAGLFDLGPLNKLLRAAGQAEVPG